MPTTPMERRERVVRNAIISNKIKFECLQLIRVNQWSPEQISGALKQKDVNVSHTTIYKWVKEDKHAGGTLFEHLRHKGQRRKANPYKKASASNIPHRTSISERPPEADGKRFGDWEMDLIIGKKRIPGYSRTCRTVNRICYKPSSETWEESEGTRTGGGQATVRISCPGRSYHHNRQRL